MRKLDSDTKRIIESYRYDKEKEINNLIIKRKEEIRNDIDKYVKEQEILWLDYDNAIGNIRKKYGDAVKVSYRFEVSNYASDYYPLYDEDEVLRGLEDSLAEIKKERKNLMMSLQFADSKSKEFKDALKKLKKE